jgi:PPP family 3-phenylpropionic acid transporter
LRLYFFASFAALGVYSPFFPRWLVARGIDGAAMGVVAATMPAMGLVSPPLVGMIADTLGLRASLLRTACLGSFLAFAALAVAGAAGHRLGFVEVFAAVLVFAVFRAPMLMMADVVAIEGERDGGSYGGIRLWGSVGFLAASVGAGHFLDPAHPTALPALVAAPLLVALFAALALPVQRGSARSPVLGDLRSLAGAADLGLFLAVACVAEFAISSYELCCSLHLADLGATSAVIGGAWGAGVFLEILLMLVAGRVLARFRPPRLVVLALFTCAIRCVFFAGVRSLPAAIVVQLLHAPSVALFWIAALTHLKERVAPRVFASAQGLFSAAAAAGSAAGMLTWGAVYRSMGGRFTFGAAAIAATAAGLLAVAWTRRARGASATSPASA